MEIITVSAIKEVASAFSSLGLTIGTLTAISAFIWICKRSGSGYAVLTKIWLKYAGRKSIQDPIIQRYLDDQESVHCFQFITSVHPWTLKNVHALIDWCNQNNIAIRDVRACGDNFDLTKPGLHLSKLFYQAWGSTALAFAIVSLIATTAAGLATITNSALMTANTSGHLFLLSTEQARVIFPSKVGRIHSSDCKTNYSELADRTRFDVQEISALCSSFADKKAAQSIRDSVASQRSLFGPVFALLAVWVVWFGRQARQASAAIRLAHKLAASDSPEIALREGRLLSWGQGKPNN